MSDRMQWQLEEEEARLTQDFQRQRAERQEDFDKHKDMIAYLEHRYDPMLAQEENEHDFEIANSKEDAQRELSGQKAECHRLRKELDALLSGLDMRECDKELVAKEQTEVSTNIRNLRLQTEDLTVASPDR